MREIISHVVSTKGKHGHGITAELPDGTRCGCGGLAAGGCAQECAVLPVKGLDNERDNSGTTAAENNSIDRNSTWVFPPDAMTGH